MRVQSAWGCIHLHREKSRVDSPHGQARVVITSRPDAGLERGARIGLRELVSHSLAPPFFATGAPHVSRNRTHE